MTPSRISAPLVAPLLVLLFIAAPPPALAGGVPIAPAPLRDAAGGELHAMIAPVGGTIPTPASPADFPLPTVAQIYPNLYQQAAFGDTDHDGHNEVFLYVNDHSTFHYRILEEQGNNVYTDEYSGAGLIPYATGDLDRDGKGEVIGQDGFYIRVYEALDANSYPTRLVWSSPSISNVVAYATIGDTDRDGRMEIITSLNPFSGNSELFIFENTGDNTFAQVYHTVVGEGANGEKVIGDLDGDGRPEIAFSGLSGQIYVYESSADNTWGRTWTASSGLYNAYGAEGGSDTDGDGRPELFIMGNGPLGWTTLVYEATGDNQFALVATLAEYDGYIGQSCNALGDLDRTGGAEYLMQGSSHFWVFTPTSPGHWDMIQQYQNPSGDSHFGLQTFDANQNGADEVFYDIEGSIESGARLWVLEHPVDPAGAPSPASSAPFLRVCPNPCRPGGLLRVETSLPASWRLDLYDASGRLVMPLGRAGAAKGSMRALPAGAAPGSYFLRAADESGNSMAATKVVLIH